MDSLKHIAYCPANVSVTDIWINHGLSHCFADTVSSSVLASYMLIFGTFQLILYRKYAIPIEDPTQIVASKLYYLQILLLLFVPVLSVVRFILESFVFVDAHIYGYTVSASGHMTNGCVLMPWLFLDSGLDAHMFLVAVFDCVDRKGTILFVAVGADARPRSHLARLLDARVRQRKSIDRQFEEGGLVVSHRHDKG